MDIFIYCKTFFFRTQIIFVFVSPYEPGEKDVGNFLVHHGDGVKDVAFHVEDLKFIIERAKERGATVVRDIWEDSDEFGTVRFATLHIVSEEKVLFGTRVENDKTTFLFV